VKLLLVAVGQRQPPWAEAAYAEFAKRFPSELRLDLKAIKAASRTGRTGEQAMTAEAERIESALPRGVRRVVLDEHGARLTTIQLATRLAVWQRDGRDVAFLIGGPDGLAGTIKQTADETMRLSDLTLPHAFARVLLAEALYRAWSVTVNHPYHRE
jgi:23S rRNA (pseudouridine1915-N3)-methyltransferase